MEKRKRLTAKAGVSGLFVVTRLKAGVDFERLNRQSKNELFNSGIFTPRLQPGDCRKQVKPALAFKKN